LLVAGFVAAANVTAAAQSMPAAPANDDYLTCHDAIDAKHFETDYDRLVRSGALDVLVVGTAACRGASHWWR
jgi:hypothetical protein